MIKVLIIVDPYHQSALIRLLHNYLPSVQVVGATHSAKQGIEWINSKKPDLVFFDAETDGEINFHYLQGITHNAFRMVVTAYTAEFAQLAFQYRPAYYLLKPFRKVHIETALRVFFKTLSPQERKRISLHNYHLSNNCLRSTEHSVVIDIRDILFGLQHKEGTAMQLSNSDTLILDAPLSYIESVLPAKQFMRISEKTILNMDYLSKIHERYSTRLILSNGTNVPVEATRKPYLLQQLQKFALYA